MSSYLRFIYHDEIINELPAKVSEEFSSQTRKILSFDCGKPPYSFGYTRVEAWTHDKLQYWWKFNEVRYLTKDDIKCRVSFEKPINSLAFLLDD